MKYKVFVSGNQSELREERFAVKDAIVNTGIFREFFEVFIFEDIAARGNNPASSYLNEVKNSNIYLGILGQKYGFKGEDGLSATEKEFDTFISSVSLGEVLIFIKGNNSLMRDEDIRKFFNKIKESFVYRRFESLDDLKRQVTYSLEQFLINKGLIQTGPFEDRINPEADYSAIDENEVKDFLQKRALKLDVDIPEGSIHETLQNRLNVLKEFNGEYVPTNTALLFFSLQASDYSLGAPIMFSIFDDRVEISNPGGLLPGMNINKLDGHHASRNQRICEIFHQTKDMEKYGTGIGKMKKLMKKHGLEEPEFSEEGDFFVVKFYGPGENILDLVSDIPDDRMVDLIELGLNDRQIQALEMMVNDRKVLTNSLYQKTFEVSRRTATRDLKGLIEVNMVYMSGIKKGTKYMAKY